MEANSQNALLGGVKTPEGKEVSKYNAVTHGVLKEVMTDYEKMMYQNLMEELRGQYQPVGFMEELLVERIGIWYLRLFRCARAEGEFMKEVLGRDCRLRVVRGTYTPTVTVGNFEDIGRTFARYDSTFENRIYKAMHELERLQRMRLGEKIAAPVPVDVNLGSFGQQENL